MKLLNPERKAPYPTVQALLREIAVALGTKSYLSQNVARKLDDSCAKKIDIHVGEFEDLKELTILKPVRDVFGDELAARMELYLNAVFERYLAWIVDHPLDGVSVCEASELFSLTGYFEDLLTGSFLEKDSFGEKLCLPDEMILTLIDEKNSSEMINLLGNKEAKDRVRLWVSGEERPSFKYVKKLDQIAYESDVSDTEWLRYKWGIIASRFIMSFQSNIKFGYITQKHSDTFKFIYEQVSTQYLKARTYVSAILYEFRSKGESCKTHKDRERIERLLELLKMELDRVNPQLDVLYVFHQLNARHLVLAGELEGANEQYKLAFEKSLYRAHSNSQIQIVIQEALLVASYQAKPDQVFLKRLKSTAILLGLDYLPAKTEEKGKYKLEVLSSNEVAAYRSEFARMFPQKWAYPSVEYPKYASQVGWLFQALDSVSESQLNKKKIKNGCEGMLQRTTTPLIEAATKNDVALVQKLLDSGASVNVVSEVGDSPLLMALTQLDFVEPTSSMDDRLFDLLSAQKHSDSVLNQRTTRKMLTPLFAAVDTGNPDVVKKVISMSPGVEIDLKAGLDFISPLYHAMSLLKLVKEPNWFEGKINNITEEAIHRLKPMMAGFTSTSNSEELGKLLRGEGLSERQKKFMNKMSEYNFNRFLDKKPSPAKIRHIARILIRKGADVDLDHRVHGMKYTPLMLAAEMDEVKLFRTMIENGGCWDKTYTVPAKVISKKKAIDCLDIAIYFKSTSVAAFIKESLL